MNTEKIKNVSESYWLPQTTLNDFQMHLYQMVTMILLNNSAT